MPDTAAGHIHATLIPDSGHEIGCRVHRATIHEGRVVQVKLTDLGADRIVLSDIGGTAYHEIEERALRLIACRRVGRIQVQFSLFPGIGDIFRHHEGEAELATPYRILSYINRIGIILILENPRRIAHDVVA